MKRIEHETGAARGQTGQFLSAGETQFFWMQELPCGSQKVDQERNDQLQEAAQVST